MENRNNRGGMRGPGMGRRPAEKSKDFKGTWMKIIRYCKRYLAVIVVALICAVAGTILTILGPDKLSDLTKVITEGIATGIDMERVKSIGLTLVVFYVGSAILSFGQQFIMATVTQNVTKQLRSDISGKINRLPMAYYNKTSTGDVLSRVTNDVDMISQSMNQSIGNLVSAVALFFGSLIMMFKTNVIMTLTAVIATMIGFGLMSLITSHSQKYFSRQQANLGALNGHIEEIYSGHTVVKAYNGEKNAKKVFDELNNNLRDSAFKAQSLSGLMQPLMAFIGNFGYVAVCVMGAVLTMKGYIGFEVIVAFMMYIRLFTQPLAQIAGQGQHPPGQAAEPGHIGGSGVAAPRRAGIDSPAAPGNDNSKRKRTEYITDEDPQTDHDGFRLEVGKRRLLRRVFFRCIGHGAGEPRHRFRFPGLRRIVFCGRSRSFVRHV